VSPVSAETPIPPHSTPARARNLIRITPDGGKEARAFSTQPLFVQGFVHLPLDAPWLSEYVSELLAFPAGARNLVDSTTQALRWLHSIIPGEVIEAEWGYAAPAGPVPEPSPIWGWADEVLEDPARAFPAPWEQ